MLVEYNKVHFNTTQYCKMIKDLLLIHCNFFNPDVTVPCERIWIIKPVNNNMNTCTINVREYMGVLPYAMYAEYYEGYIMHMLCHVPVFEIKHES